MAETQGSRSFAQRLDRLIATMHPLGAPEYSYEVIAAGVRDLGYEISGSYVWQLRHGRRTNPTLRHIQGLSEFFGVPATYFMDDDIQRAVDAELALLASLRDSGVHDLALRAHGLSAEGLATIATLVDHLRRMEHLPDSAATRQVGGDD